MSRVQGRRKPQQQQPKGSWKKSVDDEDENDSHDQCVICTERIEYAALSPCTHITCHRCTLRQRALYEKKSCLICRTENERLIFTEKLGVEYNQVPPSDIVTEDEKSGIAFTSQRAHDDTNELLANRCQICKTVHKDMRALTEHIREEHEKYLCAICTQNKKAFPYELKVYTYKQLQNHQTRGDEKGFNGHPLCKFCKGKRFYSDDELKIHLRKSHERCHVCDQLDSSNPQYFKNYESLEDHFRNDHFSCRFQSCLDEKFVVFADEFELQAHMLSVHKDSVGRGHIVGTPAHTNNNRYQLSTFRSSHASSSSSSSAVANGNGSQEADAETKRMRFEERAKHYLNYSHTGLKQFAALNNAYRGGKLTASELKNAYTELFEDASKDDIHLLLFDFTQLLAKGSHQNTELAKFVSEHEKKAAQEQEFPALPGSSSMQFGRSWGNNSTANGNGSARNNFNEAFPALPTGSSSYTPVKTKVKYTAISRTAKPSSVRVNSSPSTYVPNYLSNSGSSSSSSIGKKTSINDSEFPELPKLAPRKTFPPRNPANVPQPVQQYSVWGAGASMNTDSLEEALPVVTKGKGKKKKQLLFTMGGR